MSSQIAVRIPTRDLKAIDAAVSAGRFPSRAAAVREGLAQLLAAERERAIAEDYRRAYGRRPEDSVAGEIGLTALAASVEELERVRRPDAD